MDPAGFGAYSSHIAVSEQRCIVVPEGVSATVAVAAGLNYVTAHQILVTMLAMKPGDTVLVHGAAGGVGTAVLEMGRKIGLKVYGTASTQKHQTVRDLGGIPIDYKADDFVEVMKQAEPNGVDAVLDSIG